MIPVELMQDLLFARYLNGLIGVKPDFKLGNFLEEWLVGAEGKTLNSPVRNVHVYIFLIKA